MPRSLQTLLFNRAYWSQPAAEDWLRLHGYRVPPVDATRGFFRYRQEEPVKDAMYSTRQGRELGVLEVYQTTGAGPSGGASAASPALMPAPSPSEKIPGDRLTSDDELARWGTANIPGFLGVFDRSQYAALYPSDEPMRPGTSCVLNLDPGYEHGGTHWVAVRVAESQPQLMYFDSFGLPPPRDVTLRGRLDGRGVLYPDVQYQGMGEVNCGPRALAALKMLSDAAADGKELEAFGQLGGLY